MSVEVGLPMLHFQGQRRYTWAHVSAPTLQVTKAPGNAQHHHWILSQPFSDPSLSCVLRGGNKSVVYIYWSGAGGDCLWEPLEEFKHPCGWQPGGIPAHILLLLVRFLLHSHMRTQKKNKHTNLELEPPNSRNSWKPADTHCCLTVRVVPVCAAGLLYTLYTLVLHEICLSSIHLICWTNCYWRTSWLLTVQKHGQIMNANVIKRLSN